jgi:hypothetical protein
MSKIAIERKDAQIPDNMDAARQFLFGCLDGLGEKDQKSWRRFWNRVMKLAPGEFIQIEATIPRSLPAHRRHMKILHTVFDGQEIFQNFEMFWNWVKVGAEWVEWHPGRDEPIPIPRSVSFAEADESDFQQYHTQVMRFFRGDYCGAVLWSHLTTHQQMDMIDMILLEFGE